MHANITFSKSNHNPSWEVCLLHNQLLVKSYFAISFLERCLEEERLIAKDLLPVPRGRILAQTWKQSTNPSQNRVVTPEDARTIIEMNQYPYTQCPDCCWAHGKLYQQWIGGDNKNIPGAPGLGSKRSRPERRLWKLWTIPSLRFWQDWRRQKQKKKHISKSSK